MKSTQPQQVAGGTKTIGGIAANSLMRPIIIILAVLHIAIIGLIMRINATSAELSETMKTAGQQIEEATSVLAGTSLLSETSTNFILMPVTEHGEVNVDPLVAFATEIQRPRRGNQVLERFRNYDVSPEAIHHLTAAAGNSELLKEASLSSEQDSAAGTDRIGKGFTERGEARPVKDDRVRCRSKHEQAGCIAEHQCLLRHYQG